MLFATTLLPDNIVQVNFLENKIFKYISIFNIFVFSFVILILANLKYKRKHKNKK